MDEKTESDQGQSVDLVSIHQLERVMKPVDTAVPRNGEIEISHGVVKYSSSGATLLPFADTCRLSIRAADDTERRIISSRDSNAGRLIDMSRAIPKVTLNGRYEFMDGEWPAILTVLFRNKMRVVDVLLENLLSKR